MGDFHCISSLVLQLGKMIVLNQSSVHFEYLPRFVSCARKTLTFVKSKMQHCFVTPSFQLNILMYFCMMVQLAQTFLPVKQSFSSTPTRMNCGVHLKLFATFSVNVRYLPCFCGCLFWYLPALMLFLQLK